MEVAKRMGGKGQIAEDARVQEAIDGVGDMVKLLQYILQERKYLKHSSQLLHLWPKEDNTEESYLK